MLFDSSLRKELGRSLGATLVVILTIVLTMMLIRTLGQAAQGAVAAQDVVLIMAYVVMGFLPLILSLSLFVATMATFTRLYRDSEMSVWFSSGVGLRRFVRPVLRTALPALALLTVAALFARPWGQARIADLKEQHERRSDLSKVSPGEFQSSRDGRRVFYIDRRDNEDPVGTHVFILSNDPDRESVTTAERGQVSFEGARRMLTLSAGERTVRDTATGERSNASFERAVALVSDDTASAREADAPRAMSSWALIWQRSARHQAELAWRVGLVWSGANLLLLAIGLSKGGARQSTNWNLVLGLLSFVIYTNLMNLVQSWSGTERMQAWPAMLMLHASTLVLALALLWWRQMGSPIMRPWRVHWRART